MFNFIVKGDAWADSRDTVLAGRTFEHTEQRLVERFQPDRQTDLEALKNLPTIFAQETWATGDPVARVGTILQARIYGKDIILEYVYDPSVPPITNNRLSSFASDLDITEFEFRRTHWAVKDVDLFRVLLRHLQPRRQHPKVFQITDPERIEDTLISVMMPFSAGFDSVYSTLKATAESSGLRCRRADDIWENPAVIQDVVSLIDRSRIVICDCTGRNPNVFYEIGIAHTLGRDVILITQSESDIPFDLRHLRYVKYLHNQEGLNQLSAQLGPRLASMIS